MPDSQQKATTTRQSKPKATTTRQSKPKATQQKSKASKKSRVIHSKGNTKIRIRPELILICIALVFFVVGGVTYFSNRAVNAFDFPYRIGQKYDDEAFAVSESNGTKYYSEDEVEITTQNDRITRLNTSFTAESSRTLREYLINYKGFDETTAVITFYTSDKQLTQEEWNSYGVSLDLRTDSSKYLVCNVMWESKGTSYRVTFNRSGKVALTWVKS